MVSVRDLSDYDDFRLDEADYALVGMRTGRKFRMGDQVKIKVVSANLAKRQLDYHWIPNEEEGTVSTVKNNAKLAKGKKIKSKK